MEDDTLFIVQFNTSSKQLALISIPNARQSQNFNFSSIQAAENDTIRMKTSFISPSKIVSSVPMLYELVKPSKLATILHGYLYNQYAATDIRFLANTGWRVPSVSEFAALETYLIANGYNYDDTLTGDKIAKSMVSENLWTYYSTVGSPGNPDYPAKRNLTGLTIYPGGRRSEAGLFLYITQQFYCWTSTEYTSTRAYCRYLVNSNVSFNETTAYKRLGCYIRMFKDSTSLSHGQTGIYTGNDGKKYKTVCIGTWEILASNLAETLYRNGDEIPVVTENTEWSALASGARCAYNNDENNV